LLWQQECTRGKPQPVQGSRIPAPAPVRQAGTGRPGRWPLDGCGGGAGAAPPGVLSWARDRTLGDLTSQPGARHPMTHSEPSTRWPAVLLAAGVPLLLVVATVWCWPHQVGNVGAWLHLGGLVVVAYGLIETRSELKGRSTWAVIRGALRFPFSRWRRPGPVRLEVESVGHFTMAGSASLRVGAPRSGTDREMIEWLEEELQRLDERLD
jgi:hypothetical protein